MKVISVIIFLFYFSINAWSQSQIDSLNFKDTVIDTLPLSLNDTTIFIKKSIDSQVDRAINILDIGKHRFIQVFNKPMNFQYLRFGKKINFSKIAFDGKTKFNNTYFPKEFIISSRFRNVDFINTIFLDTVTFIACEFDIVSFDNAIFNKDVNFPFVIFNQRCNFTRLNIMDSANINFAGLRCFPDTLDFSDNPKISKEIDLIRPLEDNSNLNVNRITHKKRPCLIYLFNTDISKFRLDYVHFKLLLPDYTLGNPRLITQDEKEAMYKNLLENFERNKQLESYKLLDIEYQTFKGKSSGAGWFIWLPKLWWNFGYDKHYIFFWTMFFLFLFTTITYSFLSFLNANVYRVEQVPILVQPEKNITKNNFKNRLWYSFLYTFIIFFGIILRFEKIKFQNKTGAAYVLTIYLIGLICIGYIANYIIQK